MKSRGDRNVSLVNCDVGQSPPKGHILLYTVSNGLSLYAIVPFGNYTVTANGEGGISLGRKMSTQTSSAKHSIEMGI